MSGTTLADALAAAPLTEKAYLEVRPRWEHLDEALATAADVVSLRIVTWDPFEWEEARAPVTATIVPPDRSAGVEVIGYATVWATIEDPDLLGRTAAALLARVAADEPAVREGTLMGRVAVGDAEPLLARPADEALVPGTLEVAGTWQAMDPPVIEDLVEATYGPTGLDHRPPRLAPASEPMEDCPICAGTPAAFPFPFAPMLPTMCPEHRAAGTQVVRERLDAARAAHPVAMEALDHATAAGTAPHLPGGTRRRALDAADRGDLLALADVVRSWGVAFAEEPTNFEGAIADDIELLEDDLIELPGRLRLDGHAATAALVADALRKLLRAPWAHFSVQMAAALADTGMRDEARTVLTEVSTIAPDDALARLDGAVVLEELGRLDEAAEWLERARVLAIGLEDWLLGLDAVAASEAFAERHPDHGASEGELARQRAGWELRRSRARS
ncbi:MAG: hypothetical protein S0880_28820 [Actinomycetota bacterium]|nr:hypothetical protein [Actinomycetota bacterium]